MTALLDIRAREVVALRGELRRLESTLRQLNGAARVNDSVLLTLHKLAVFLLENKSESWRTAAEDILQKGLKVNYCKITVFASRTDTARRVARLPKNGRVGESAMIKDDGCKARCFFHLPLGKTGAAAGLLTLGDNRQDAFLPQDERDFMKRLAQLLTARLSTE